MPKATGSLRAKSKSVNTKQPSICGPSKEQNIPETECLKGPEPQRKRDGRTWYAECLTDPRWQRKRLEVMQSADFKCEYCGNGAQTLHIHHLKYTGMPWDAPMSDLECLCDKHHRMREQNEGMPCLFIFKKHRAARVAEFERQVLSAFERGVKMDAITKAIAELSREDSI